MQARNLDWDMESLIPLTRQVDFARGERVLFTATTWLGFVGVSTGMRRGGAGWSVALNYRKEGGWLAQNVYSALSGSAVSFFAMRRVLQSTDSYREAVRQLSQWPFIGPAYLILAGSKRCVWDGWRMSALSPSRTWSPHDHTQSNHHTRT